MWDSTDRTHNTPQIMTLKSNLLKYMFLLSAYQSGKIRANDAFVLRHFHLGMKNSQPYQILKASFRHFTHPNTKSKIQVSEPECAAVAWCRISACSPQPSCGPAGHQDFMKAPGSHHTGHSLNTTEQQPLKHWQPKQKMQSGGGCGGSRGEMIHSSLSRRLIAYIWAAQLMLLPSPWLVWTVCF